MQLKPIILGMLTGLGLGLSFLIFSSISSNVPENSSPAVMSQVSSQETLAEVTLGAQESFDILTRALEAVPGNASLYIHQVNSGARYEYNASQTYYAASLYKLLVGGAVYDLISKDRLSLNYVYTYTARDYLDGTGLLQHYPVGTTYTVKELLDLLYKHSDNIAQNILVRNIGEPVVVSFYTEFLGKPEVSGRFFSHGEASPDEIGTLLLELYQREAWARTERRAYFDHMVDTAFDDRISQGLSSDLLFAHKIGNWPALSSWHDCGIVFSSDYTNPTVVCFMTSDTDYQDFLDLSEKIGLFVSSLEQL